MKLAETKSIIFDLDGTLWDPTNIILKAWDFAMNKISYITEPITKDELQGVFGLQHDLIGFKLFPYLTKEQREEIIEICFQQEVDSIKDYGGDLYNNLEEVLISLSSKYKLYIVSNCQAGYIEAFYSFHKLDRFFIDEECSGNTGKSKSENIKMIIERNNIENPIYIGDTQGDFDATNVNNIPFIYAEYGFGKVEEYEYKISSIEELNTLL